MKRTALLLLLTVVALRVAAQLPVMPPFLKEGDRIAVISPCSQPEEKTLRAGCDMLRQWGYVPVVGPHARSLHHGFAGTTAERLSDLLWALRDSTISAIMCTRGGDGAPHLLPHVSPQEWRRQPKWLIGFSDVTALHSASVSAGVMSLHGSMLHAISAQQGQDTVSVVLRRLLRGQLPTYHTPHHPLDQTGQAEGLLVGGNLSVLCGLAASPYDCLSLSATTPLILFIEDTDESIAKVDRMLHQLLLRGVLQRLRGIVVGHFTKYKHPENDYADMYSMLSDYLRPLGIPVSYAFPVGHQRPNFPLVEGCRVRLSVGPGGTTLQYLP